MKETGYVIFLLLIIAGFAIAAGCSTMAPAPKAAATGTSVAVTTDAGFRIITDEAPPFSYTGQDGKAAGHATDVVNGILARLNQTAAIEVLPWNEGYALARTGPRVILYLTGRTSEREDLFKWVGPINSIDYMLYARNGTGLTVSSLEVAKTAGRIAVLKDDVRDQFLQENGFSNITTCDSDDGCLRDLMAGRSDLWLGSSATSVDMAQKEGIDPSAFTPLYQFRTVSLYIAFSPDTPDPVIARWQDVLDAMKQDGTSDAIWKTSGTA